MQNSKPLQYVLRYFKSINIVINSTFQKYGKQHTLLASLIFLNYLIATFLSNDILSSHKIFNICSIIAMSLCVGLYFIGFFLQRQLAKLMPLYWYLTIWFCIPFFSSLAVFETKDHEVWIVSSGLSLLLLVILVDWMTFTIATLTGVFIAYFISLYVDDQSDFFKSTNLSLHDIFIFAHVCLFVILTSIVLLRKKNNIQDDKIEYLKIFSSAIAHEVRGPISTTIMLIDTMIHIINDIKKDATLIPNTLSSHEKLNDLDDDNNDDNNSDNSYNCEPVYNIKINKTDYVMLTEVIPNNALFTSQNAANIVDLLLTIIKNKFIDIQDEYYISEIVNEVITHCFLAKADKNRILVNVDNDFIIRDSKQLITQVITNLIYNAIKHSGPNTIIKIWFEKYDKLKKTYIMHVYDNGCGIDESHIKDLFKISRSCDMKAINAKSINSVQHNINNFISPNYSNDKNGIGLAFCNIVMKLLHGDIKCHSEVGKYTDFTLIFNVFKSI